MLFSIRSMSPGVLVNLSLSGLASLATPGLAAHPNTIFPVRLELIRRVEFLLAPSFTTEIPLTLLRFIGVMVSRKTVIK